MPIALTDAQLDTIMRAATPLAPPDRRAFLAAVADALQGVVEIVSRVCAEQQRRWFTPPAEEGFGAQWEGALVEKPAAR
jgi:hypothetical protein